MNAIDLLRDAIRRYGSRLAITTSFQSEGMVVVDMAASIAPDIRVITLDTGRLPEETHAMIRTVRDRYGIAVEVVTPDEREIDTMVERYGRDLFRDSVAKRRLCCEIRKVRPLERKLAELDAWVVGLRRGQSATR
jgi:phosphoadenylyl-sulfate reductase (thioredoxin)